MSETIKRKLPSGLAVEFRRPGPYAKAQAMRAVPSFVSRPAPRRRKKGEPAQVQADEASGDNAVVRTMLNALEDQAYTVEMICICSVKPKFFTGDKPPISASPMHIDDLSEADFSMLIEVFTESDTTAAEVAEVDPSSKAEPSSPGSTPSESDTAASPADAASSTVNA